MDEQGKVTKSFKMPGIVLYNRRWALGSDDILLPAVVLALVHVVWWDFWIWDRDTFYVFGPPHCQYQKEKLLQPTLRFHGPGVMLVGCNSFSFSALKMGRTLK